MSSKDWKLGVFALAAAVLLSACSDDKKKNEATTPFTGIWVQQENLQTYSEFRGELEAGERRGYCEAIHRDLNRFGDRQYRLRALVVQSNGEVFRYSPSDSTNAVGYRERNFMGVVNASGAFTSQRIGPDGRATTRYASNGRYDLPIQTNMLIKGDLLTIAGETDYVTYERHVKTVVDEYAIHTSYCLQALRRSYERARHEGPQKDEVPPGAREHDEGVDERELSGPGY